MHLGLEVEQERQLFHDLNRLVKKVDPSLALQFDSSNPITGFIKQRLGGDLAIHMADSGPDDWSQDTGAVVLKDMVAVNAIAFLNKGNVSGATPAVIEPRESIVLRLWEKIIEIPNFGSHRAKEQTVAAQSVVLKALAKITYDLNFSNRKPANAEELFDTFLERLHSVDFSHHNPLWNYYGTNEDARDRANLASLANYLPPEDGIANRDMEAFRGASCAFGAKHNDIFPIVADMVCWQTGLPSRFLDTLGSR